MSWVQNDANQFGLNFPLIKIGIVSNTPESKNNSIAILLSFIFYFYCVVL